jgi:hypothetical protein
MRNNQLFSHLMGLVPGQKIPFATKLNPDTDSHFFLSKGHVMEYIRFGSDEKRVVSLFFGPNEFVVRCHQDFSSIVALDRVKIVPFTYGILIQTLKNHPESRIQYQEMRERYATKVEDRIRVLESMSGAERYEHLKSTQPWVFSLAGKADIASYLGISVDMLKKLKK